MFSFVVDVALAFELDCCVLAIYKSKSLVQPIPRFNTFIYVRDTQKTTHCKCPLKMNERYYRSVLQCNDWIDRFFVFTAFLVSVW